MKRIVDRYIIREFIPPFLGGLCLFSFILIMDKVFKLTDLIFIKGIGLGTLGRLLLYLLPPLFSFTIPMAILFASLMAYGRLSSDNEIIAFRNSGFHPVRLMIPILIFSLFAALVCLWLEVALIPYVNRSFRAIVFSFQKEKTFLTLNERDFQGFGENMLVYVHKIQKEPGDERTYSGVLITDYSQEGIPRVILAREGHIMMDQFKSKIMISLRDGGIHKLEREGKRVYQMMDFGGYETDLKLPSSDVVSGTKKKEKEFSLKDIKEAIQSDTMDFKEEVGLRFEWHRKFAFPFACVIFAFIGSLIGMESKWSGKSSSFAVSLLVIIIYYFLLTLGSRLSMAGYMPPEISAWFPNITFTGIGLLLMRGI